MKKSKTKTILITKDINLRMKALSLGLMAEDYINDKVTNHNIFDKNHEIYENVPIEIIDKLYSSEAEISVDELDFASDIEPQDCLFCVVTELVFWQDIFLRQTKYSVFLKRDVLVLSPVMQSKHLQ